jgi:HAD superfamily hydrolase (TIGR01450 family)
MGIEACPDDVLTSGEATVRNLLQETPYRRVYAIGTPSFEEELRRAGIANTTIDPEAVVLAFDTGLTYAKLERACLFLSEGLPYIATNPDKVCPTDYGSIPDCGATAALLEAATGRVPKYIGKPHTEMIRMGLEKLGARAEETAMVGDRLYTDMEMAFRAGTTSVLVLSGEATREQVAAAPRRPDFVFHSVADITRVLRGEEVADAMD